MKKKSLLSVFILASICSAAYCADDAPVIAALVLEAPLPAPEFEPNIQLPLKGKRIDNNHQLDWNYANCLGNCVTMGACVIGVGTLWYILGNANKREMGIRDNFYAHVAKENITLLKDPAIWNKLAIAANESLAKAHRTSLIYGTAAAAATVCGTTFFGDWLRNKSRLAINQYNNNLLGSRISYNQVVSNDPVFEGMVSTDEEGNRTLSTRLPEAPYIICRQDQLRQERQEARSGFLNKVILGPKNLSRAAQFEKQIEPLYKQLIPTHNIKKAHHSIE